MRGYTAIRCLNFLVNNWFFTLAVSVSRFAYDANNLIANDCGEIKSNFPIGFEQGMQDFNTSGIYAPPAGSHERNDLIMPEVILSFISAAIFALAIRQGIQSESSKIKKGLLIGSGALASISPTIAELIIQHKSQELGLYAGYLSAFIHSCKITYKIGCSNPEVMHPSASLINDMKDSCRPHLSSLDSMLIDLGAYLVCLSLCYGLQKALEKASPSSTGCCYRTASTVLSSGPNEGLLAPEAECAYELV